MLRYKVLWIDDNYPETKVDGIKDFLEEEGFSPDISFKDTTQGIEDELEDPEIDIVITDFNLGDIDVKDVVSKIREKQKYIDLILYSENPPEGFRDVLNEFDGVYGCIRDDVEDTIINVIRNTIRRTQNVNNMRGVVISEAIDIENQIEKIILSYFQNEKDLVEKVLKSRGSCDFGKKISFLNSIIKKINKSAQDKKDDTSFEPQVQKQFEEILEKLKPYRNKCKKLGEDVMKPRNILAHVEHKINHDSKPFLKSLERGCNEIVIDTQWCKDTRVRLKEHSSNLEALNQFISQCHEL